MNEYRRLATIGRSFNIDSELLSPSETVSKFPLINKEIIRGSLYIPGSGVVNPLMLCQALIQAATKNGAKVSVNKPCFLPAGSQMKEKIVFSLSFLT